jgi:hypothetical protein
MHDTFFSLSLRPRHKSPSFFTSSVLVSAWRVVRRHRRFVSAKGHQCIRIHQRKTTMQLIRVYTTWSLNARRVVVTARIGGWLLCKIMQQGNLTSCLRALEGMAIRHCANRTSPRKLTSPRTRNHTRNKNENGRFRPRNTADFVLIHLED